jgi:hypothetical protein
MIDNEKRKALRVELLQDPAHLDYAALKQDYPAIARLVNARPTLPNPLPQGNIAKRLEWSEVLLTLTVAERLALYERPALLTEFRAVVGGNRPVAEKEAEVVVRAVDLDVEPQPAPSLLSRIFGRSSTLATADVEPAAESAVDAVTPIVKALLTESSKLALDALLKQTQPDPSWSPTVYGQSRGDVLGLGVVNEHDVQAALLGLVSDADIGE